MNRPRLIFAWTALLLGAAAVHWTGCSKAPADKTAEARPHPVPALQSPAWFNETSGPAQLNFRHRSGAKGQFYNPEIVCGGVGLLDYDADGYLDVFCVQGGSLDPAHPEHPGHKLYHNLGNGRFEDVSERAGIGGTGYGYGMGCACADYDQDGKIDIFVTQVGTNILYHNNGDGTFTDVTVRAGLAGERAWGTSAAFFDYDGDGRLDLFVANYLKWSPDREVECYSRGGLRDYCSPLNYRAPAMDRLYHNEGNGTFADVTLAAGLDKAYGNGLGVLCADFDGDGRIDIFVANDAMPNQLWMNQGNGHFKDEALIRGCAVNGLGIAEAGMGVVAADFQKRGWLDLFVTHLVGEGNRLFANTNGFFTDVVPPKGPGAPSLPYTAFGIGADDFDNDGELDLYIANGRVKYGPAPLDPHDPYAEPNTLLRGLGGWNFEEVMPQGGVSPPLIATSRGLAIGDLDNDGGIDIVVVNRDGPLHFLKNAAARRGHWITFALRDALGDDPIEAQVTLEAGGTRQVRAVRPNQGYCSSNDPRVHFGLGKSTEVAEVTVRWPRGKVEHYGPFAADKIYTLRQGTGR